MAIELGGIKLNRVHRLVTLEQADLVSQRVPGREGGVVQDLGRDSVRLEIHGIFYGAATASQDLEALRKIYKQRQPVDFMAEIVGQAYFSRVILERFEVFQLAGEPEQFSYKLTIAEYVVPQKAKPVNVDAGIKASAANFMTVATLPDALRMGALPEITNPIEPLKAAINPVQEATKNTDSVIQDLKGLLNL